MTDPSKSTPHGVLRYNEQSVTECLKGMSSELVLNGADSLIIAAFRIAKELAASGSSASIAMQEDDRYSVYLRLCEELRCKPRGEAEVKEDQEKWLSDPSAEVDPVSVMSLKSMLWSAHASAPDGAMERRCPVCSSEPDFFYIDSDGRLHMVCSRCDYDWRYYRIGCPFCGDKDPRHFSYIVSEDGFARLHKCYTCGHQILGVDSRHARRPFCYFLEKLLTGYVLSTVNR